MAPGNFPEFSRGNGQSSIDDPMSPYFLHHSDNPGLTLVSQSLNGDNYASWIRAMRIANFGQKQDISASVLFSESAAGIWEDLKEHFQHSDGSAAGIWEYLKEHFQQSDGPRIFQLPRDLVNLRQGKLSLSQVLLLDPLPPINRVFSLVVQEERNRAISAQVTAPVFTGDMEFALKNDQSHKIAQGRGSARFPKERPFCTKCNVHGNTVDTCYKIHGYPPGFKLRGNTTTRDQLQQLRVMLDKHITSHDTHNSSINASKSLHITVTGSTITLPNHTTIEVKFCGSIKLGASLILEDVMFIPSFEFNLLSVSSIIATTKSMINFYHDSFIIQEVITRKMICKEFGKRMEEEFKHLCERYGQVDESGKMSKEQRSTTTPARSSKRGYQEVGHDFHQCPNEDVKVDSTSNLDAKLVDDLNVDTPIVSRASIECCAMEGELLDDVQVISFAQLSTNLPIETNFHQELVHVFLGVSSKHQSVDSFPSVVLPLILDTSRHETLIPPSNAAPHSLELHTTSSPLVQDPNPPASVSHQHHPETSNLHHTFAAMRDELDAMEANHTWSVVPIPTGKQAIGFRWVYKIKYTSNGSVDRHKAQLMAKGYTQQEGDDFFETFSPVAKLATVKVLLALATSQPWNLAQLDVNNAFLNGDLFQEVYMDLPLGYVQHGSPIAPSHKLVCKLHKSIYGLRQAQGLLSSPYWCTLMIIIVGPSSDIIQSLKTYLQGNFKLKDLGSLKYFLGLEIARSQHGICLSQRHYSLTLLENTDFLASKQTPTPMEPRLRLNNIDGEPLVDISQYRSIIGRLLYLTFSRPDIMFAVHKLSQFVSKPRTCHLQPVHHLLRYLKSTPGQGIYFSASSSTHLRAFSDADWASCPDTRKSVIGFCIFLGDALVAWKAKKQATISRSSTEAEYRALASTTSEILWLIQLLRDFHIHPSSPPTLFCDSQSAMHIAHNPLFHERAKHIEIDCHFIRGKILDGSIKLLPIRLK
ncbi:uncharacterized protein [Primulina eburnea]|uniref:uncharacterized protein n=1 Tax=Primulina eburnea TaxID=1245227 RepID=UPI003C6C447B